ncbi:MAG: Gfo/Idh/MocA family oxidoreductase [Anaerolineae bacterium]|nr:Gfo/Idh/MocA family oxidoreductase [Anaerolineae bacterium]
MTVHRLAIIGTGKSVGNHLSAIRAMGERVELVAAVDLDETRVRAISEANGIPRWYTDSAAMLAAEQPDLVHIVTPPAPHKALILQAMDAGAWVFCEKPLCASLAEFDEITRAEERTGRRVSTVFQWRFGSAAKHLKRLIQTQALGKPLVGVCNTLWYRTQEYYDAPWRGSWKTEVGGPTVTLGVHLADLFLWLLDDWCEVTAMAGTLDRDIEVEDVSMALVRFASGALGTITNSALSPRQETYMRLDFQQASVEVTALYRYRNEHWQFTLPEGVENPAALAQWQALTEDVPGNHDAQLRDLLDCLERGETPPVSGEEARRILEFAASLYKSAFTGKRVMRGEITPDDPFYDAMNGSLQETPLHHPI